MLTRIADFYNLSLDQLIRDEYDLPITEKLEETLETEKTSETLDISQYLGKVCDVSMNSFRCSVIRNVKIVGYDGDMVCFEKRNKYGYFNIKKCLGILVKKPTEAY